MIMTMTTIVAGYYTSWSIYPPRSYPITSVPVELLTHINYAFANIVDGVICSGDAWADHDQVNEVDGRQYNGQFGLINDPNGPIRSRRPSLRTLISIGGWTFSKDFCTVTRTLDTRRRFVASVRQYVDRYGFDGVDIDWEFPISGGHPSTRHCPHDTTDLTALIQDLRAALPRPRYLLTIASPAGQWAYKHMQLTELVPFIDWFNVMCYDASGPWSTCTAAHSPVSLINSVMSGYHQQHVPPSSICIGIPLYARSFGKVAHGRPGAPFQCSSLGTHEVGIVDHDDMVNVINDQFESFEHDGTVVWHNPQTQEWLTGETEATVASKSAMIMQQGLRGVFAWELSMDKQGRLIGAMQIGNA